MTAPTKRQRSCVARHACDRCRVKKTRCDEEFPCGLCRSVGVECLYSSRKAIRNSGELSSGEVRRVLSRFESTLETITARVETAAVPRSTELQIHNPSTMPSVAQGSPQLFDNSPASHSHVTTIPFSAHQVISWPAVAALLPDSIHLILCQCGGPDYSTTLESKRPPLSVTASRKTGASDALAHLTIATAKELCDSYFSTFHLATPILDRDFYQRHTLSTAFNGNFGDDMESCVVLVVMALGSWGKKALSEAGFRLSESDSALSDDEDDIPGLRFFNESRRRIGWLMNDNGIQSCQYYLLAGSSGRLVDDDYKGSYLLPGVLGKNGWLVSMPDRCDTWVVDMQSRLFWNTAMFEAILTKELNLPGSGLHAISDQVPLPKFVKLEQPPFLTDASRDTEDESFFHYHFLAQTAHRILLTRADNSIFYCTPDKKYPLTSLEEELSHQLEQWRSQLPLALQFEDDHLVPLGDSPGDILVVSWLRARYLIAKYHFGRPLLHKVLSYPMDATEEDLQRCREVFRLIFSWEPIIQVMGLMKNCMPLKFQISAQLFGQMLVMYCFRRHPDLRLQQALPPEFQPWCTFALEFLQDAASYSPTLAKDAEIATILCREGN
ncbi:hypothetical protein FE257_006385 [Aspergillus nanangensis]|uniref:Zn(2)-C6 fungal-type domain-containing protein n=1 Tax=Aspergillus nanangensis TaxID=2582783 RepID=A0AAD4CXU2_ASPNN|nr:hypothetical protein FE257_006385 [Aspergillus nanangensis]